MQIWGLWQKTFIRINLYQGATMQNLKKKILCPSWRLAAGGWRLAAGGWRLAV
jgi:hypothetical protein